MVRFSGTGNIDRWLVGWRKRVKEFEKRTSATPRQVAEWGAKKGKTIAPKDTGALVQAISWKRVGSQKRGSGKAFIWVRNMNNNKYLGKRSRVSRYAAIHANSELGARWQAKTGDPHWFRTVKREGRERFKKEIIGHIQKFIRG